jgi:hypothetical protein
MRISALPLRRLALVVPLAASLGGCMTWSRQPAAAPGQDRFFATARVTRGDGSVFVLDNVTVGRDSVVGRNDDAARSRIALPLAEVRSVEARRENALGTLALMALGAAAALALYAAAVISTIGTGS